MNETTTHSLAVRYTADLTGFLGGAAKVNQVIAAQQTTIRANFGTLASSLNSMGTTLAVGLTLPIILAGRAVAGTVMQMDSLKRGLTAVMGSASAAEGEFKKLVEVAKLPGLGIEEAVRGSVGLQAAGIGADQARNALMGFGKAIATVGGGRPELDGVNRQLVQMAGSGKILEADLRIIKQYMPQLSAAMKSAYGTASAQAVAGMGVGASEFITRISAELNKLPDVGGGMKNAWENAMDAMKMSMLSLKDAVAPIITSIAGWIEKASNALQNLSPGVKSLALKVIVAAAALGPFLKLLAGIPGLCSGVSLAIRGIGIAFKALKGALISNPIGWIILAIGVVIPLVIKFRNQLGLTDQRLAAAKKAFTDLGKQIWATVGPAFKSLWKALQDLWAAIKPVVDIVVKLAGGAVLGLLKLQLMQVKAFCLVLAEAVKQLTKYFSFLVSGLTTVINKLREWFSLQDKTKAMWAALEKGPRNALGDAALFIHKGLTESKEASAQQMSLIIAMAKKAAEAGVKASRERASSAKEETAALLTQAKDRVTAIQDEIKALKEKALAQVGFSSLRGIWEKGMETGSKERLFAPPISGINQGQSLSEAQRQTTLLDQLVKRQDETLKKWDKLLAAFEEV